MSAVEYLWPLETGIKDIDVTHVPAVSEELRCIAEIWAEHRERLEGTSQPGAFIQKLNREWAIETGVIENLYDIDRGVTQTLIEHGFKAALIEHGSVNRPREYVLRLLEDQKETIEGIELFAAQNRELTTSYIKSLHSTLCRSQKTVEAYDSKGQVSHVTLRRGDWKIHPNYPMRDGVEYRYCPPEQVSSEMDRLMELHARHTSQRLAPAVSSAWLHHRFTIIHPFQDGNGRLARAFASLVFIRSGLFPVIVTRDDKAEYIRALEAADADDLKPMVTLFERLQRVQFRKAMAISDSFINTAPDVAGALQGLKAAISKRNGSQASRYAPLFEHAQLLSELIETRLNGVAEEARPLLLQLHPHSSVQVDTSTPETDFYFNGQISEVCRRYRNYAPDVGGYRQWIRLRIQWPDVRAQFVIALYPLGSHVSGVLSVMPFVELTIGTGDGTGSSTLTNIVPESFEIYYNESAPGLAARFMPWLEAAIAAMLTQLQMVI